MSDTAIQETVVKATTKTKGSANLIHDIAVEIESLTKTKALNQAEKLAEDIDTNYFKLGGVLKLIFKEQWYEGFPSFGAFIGEKFGFGQRKADYLISIYTNLVDKQIPWEKVSHLGWTKLKDLAGILTLANLDEWVAKATPVTVAELQALIKASNGTDAGGTTSEKTTADSVVMKFKLHNDQASDVQSALAKAKGELGTDFDNVALAGICSGYLANANGVAGAISASELPKLFASMGYQDVLKAFETAFPDIDMSFDVSKHVATTA